MDFAPYSEPVLHRAEPNHIDTMVQVSIPEFQVEGRTKPNRNIMISALFKRCALVFFYRSAVLGSNSLPSDVSRPPAFLLISEYGQLPNQRL